MTTRTSSIRGRLGFTLPELLISMVILSMMSVVLAGMSHAVNSAWTYTQGVESTEQQAAAALGRMKFMVSQSGTYRLNGQPARLGMAVVNRTVGSTSIPDVLVLWTGGRDGGMAALGTQTRLPVASELLIYSGSSGSPNQLIEVAFPGNTAVIDFLASNFTDTITALLASATAERIPLTDRLRVSSLSTSASAVSPGISGTSYSTSQTTPMSPYGNSTTSYPASTTAPVAPAAAPTTAGTTTVGGVRFGLAWNPSNEQLASASPQTAQWLALGWPQGAVGSQSGLRQATVNIEVQIEPAGVAANASEITAIPFFASASVRYVYEP